MNEKKRESHAAYNAKAWNDIIKTVTTIDSEIATLGSITMNCNIIRID